MGETLFNLTTTGRNGEVIGTPSFLIADPGYSMDGDDAMIELREAVNRWFVDVPIEDARAEAAYSGGEYNIGDLLCSSQVLQGPQDYGITVLDGEVPAGGPYRIADAIESHCETLLDATTLARIVSAASGDDGAS